MRDFSVIVNADGNRTGSGGMGEWKSLDLAATKEGIHSHLRPGYMIPHQTCGNITCGTTTDLQN
jgi:hypothetical protein